MVGLLCDQGRGSSQIQSTQLWNRLNAWKKRNIYKQRRPRWDAAKRGVSSGSTLFAKINTLLVMVDYRNCIWSGPHSLCVNWWQIIKGCLWWGDTNIFTNSVKIGFREIRTHFVHITSKSIRIVIEYFKCFWPKYVRKCVFAYTQLCPWWLPFK